MDDAQLLAELEDCLTAMPPRNRLNWDNDEITVWYGRATAIISVWNPIQAVLFRGYIDNIRNPSMWADGAINSMLTMLQEARFALRMKVGPLSIAVNAGRPFEYFEGLRSTIAAARTDIYFVDRFLEAEFVRRYLTQVAAGVPIRLLARDLIPQLLPAVEMFAQQEKRNIEVRSSTTFHDRFVFIDHQGCYFSGASFKDGGRQSPAMFAQIVDCAAFIQQYEAIWSAAKVERKP